VGQRPTNVDAVRRINMLSTSEGDGNPISVAYRGCLAPEATRPVGASYLPIMYIIHICIRTLASMYATQNLHAAYMHAAGWHATLDKACPLAFFCILMPILALPSGARGVHPCPLSTPLPDMILPILKGIEPLLMYYMNYRAKFILHFRIFF
jgi:hypothetical protein